MTRLLLRLTLLALLLPLAACGGGPRGDWRAQAGRPTPNLLSVTPRPPLVIPSTFDLPPPPALAQP